MKRSYFSLALAALCLAVASVPRAIAAATERISERFWDGIAFLVRTLAYAETPRLALDGWDEMRNDQVRFYDVPTDRFLRHEARVSLRSADRHI